MASPSPVPRATDTAEIGRTGLCVSRLGLGGVALSGAPARH
jgi:aryl-alcohol dehydrogenase-like predicted oxidoreductase